MELLGRISVGSAENSRSIELYRGDLVALPEAHAVDLLVVSAFPDDYLATAGSLIGALAANGVSVAELAAHKALDLRSERSCWLSGEIAGGRGFTRILCFEPLRRGRPPELVDDLFDSLDQVMLGDCREGRVAMPLLATGDMAWPSAEMLPALLDAAVARLRIGLPLRVLKIVEREPGKAELLQRLFKDYVDAHGGHFDARPPRHPRPPPAAPEPVRRRAGRLWRRLTRDGLQELARRLGRLGGAGPGAGSVILGGGADGPLDGRDGDWDIFVSYSRRDTALVDSFVAMVRAQYPEARIFRDSESIRAGMDWITRLAEAIDASRSVVALFSPDYFDSTWCKREFNAAIIRADQGDDELLYPLYLRDDKQAPSLYLTFNLVDCREADAQKMLGASRKLVTRLKQH
ncbi:MAG: toll/interleukin-1 receptor domain-containing protein [Gammaproteobacteria bacterium]|nr:toll/interleukin-1 receptor domain-containing protein [Gammaproteobacteria bacterium]